MKKNSIGRSVSLGIVLAIILSFVTPPGFAASEKKTDLQILGKGCNLVRRPVISVL